MNSQCKDRWVSSGDSLVLQQHCVVHVLPPVAPEVTSTLSEGNHVLFDFCWFSHLDPTQHPAACSKCLRTLESLFVHSSQRAHTMLQSLSSLSICIDTKPKLKF
jgi:hypothetical protein